MKNYDTSTTTEVDNYNIDNFLDFCIAKSLIIRLKSNSRSITNSMLIYNSSLFMLNSIFLRDTGAIKVIIFLLLLSTSR